VKTELNKPVETMTTTFDGDRPFPTTPNVNPTPAEIANTPG
jgi:hypothetical protein